MELERERDRVERKIQPEERRGRLMRGKEMVI
jgi:hypothetical protein